MNSKIVNYFVIITIFLFGLIVLNACSLSEVKEDAETTVVKEIPNEANIATTYIISGGGAAGYVYKLVNIRNKAESFNPNKGIILQISGTGGQNIDLEWKDSDKLIVKYPQSASVQTKLDFWEGKDKIQINYIPQ